VPRVALVAAQAIAHRLRPEAESGSVEIVLHEPLRARP